MVTSPFSSRVRRPILPPIGLQSVFREVRTEDELRQALTPLDLTTGALTLASSGRRIVIAAPITLRSTVVIPRGMIGTTIEAHGHIPIIPTIDGMDAFDIRAGLVTIRGLVLYGTAAIGWGKAFILSGNVDGSTRIIDNHVIGADQLVDDQSVGDAAYCYVERNLLVGGSSSDAIACDSPGWRIAHNTLITGGAGDAISVGANGGQCAIIGNNCNAAGITTSASAGSNTISANTRAGVVTAHATDDALGGNT